MVSKFLSSFARPVTVYLEATLAGPCRSICEHQKKPVTRRQRKNTGSFSLVHLIMEQRRQISPEVPSEILDNHSLRDRYVRKTGLGGTPLVH